MLNDEEKYLINSFEGNENLKEWIKSVKKSNNPFFLQESAVTYNWDDGFELPTVIANNTFCDKGIALTLFWLAEGITIYTKEVEKNDFDAGWANFSQMIGDRLINNYYKEGKIGFIPEISRVTVYKYKKKGIPSVLYEAVRGIEKIDNTI